MAATLHVAVWILAALLVYPYTLYPLLLWILSKVRPRRWQSSADLPALSLIIPAHNEAKVLADKLENTLALDYPHDRIQIIVVSDCSVDRTNEIARQYAPDVELLELTERSGKQTALNKAVQIARGEVLVFSDASVILPASSLKNLVRAFGDSKVGAVSSVIKLIPNSVAESMTVAQIAQMENRTAANTAEGTYLDLDLMQRRMESLVASAVGCCGSCYAVRKECFQPFDAGAASDFVSALDTVRSGFRVVMDNGAVGLMTPAKSQRAEFRRKVRTIAGGLDTFWKSGAWKTGYGSPIFWWELMSHKLARWLGPPILLAILILAGVGVMQKDLALSILFAAIAIPSLIGLLGILVPILSQKLLPVKLCSFAFIAGAAGVMAWLVFLQRKQQVTWQPTER